MKYNDNTVPQSPGTVSANKGKGSRVHPVKGKNDNRRRYQDRRSSWKVGMVCGQCWNCKQRDVSCGRLESGKFVCRDCDLVTYGEVARVEKERWISGK